MLVDERASELEETSVSKHVRTLNIVSLTPSCSPESDSDFKKKQEQFKYTHDIEQVKSWVESGGVQSKLAEEQLRELLEPALKSLRRLDTVRYVSMRAAFTAQLAESKIQLALASPETE